MAVLDPLDLSPAVIAWAEGAAGLGSVAVDDGELAALAALRRLHALFLPGGAAGIVEVTEPTPTAAEAFVGRRADCLGFALLLVALAREEGIAAGFAVAGEPARRDRRAGLAIRRGHVVATFGGRIFDLAGERAFAPPGDAPLTDRAAIALFFSNRGAQSLVDGVASDAVELFYRALRADPSVPAVWSNLGVALARIGDPRGALLAEEMAVRLDPDDENARANLLAARARLAVFEAQSGGAVSSRPGRAAPGRALPTPF